MSELEFAQRVNQARHDKAFQCFLALSFGQRFEGIDRDPRTGETVTVVVFSWRNVNYITKVLRSPP